MLRAICAAILVLLPGCDSSKKLGIPGATCSASSDCAGELQCVAATCVDPKVAATPQDAKQAPSDAKVTTARKDAEDIEKASEQFMLQKQNCPKNMEELKSAGVINRILKDPWGQDFVLRCIGDADGVEVISPGPDRTLGGTDDISSAN